MPGALEQWIIKLQRSSLPALKSSVEQMVRLAADENVPMERLARVVQRDPGLTLHVLRRIASLRRRHLSNEVGTTQHALMMLGLAQIRNLAAGLPVDTQLKPPLRLELRRVFSRAFHAAYQARDWVRLHKDFEPDEVFTAALLHPLGEMLVQLYAPAKMHQIMQLTCHKGMEPAEAQYVVLGFSLEELTRQLAERWQLPMLLLDSLHPENAQRDRVYAIMLSAQLARCAEHDWYSAETTRIIEQVADYLPMSFGSAAAHIHRIAVDAARETEYLRVAPAAARLLYPSRPEADPEWKPEPPPEQDPEDEEEIDFCLAPQLGVLKSALAGLSGRVGSLNLNETVDLAMRGMHEGVGLNRVVFALLTPDKGQLRARAVVGSESDAHFSRFAIDMYGDHLFSRLMQKPQALWLDEKNRGKFWPMVPQAFRELVETDRFFLMSVFVKGKPVGLFYADRHSKACHLDPRAYHRFKQMATQLAEALARFSKD